MPTPAILIVDLEINPASEGKDFPIFKLGAYRPDLNSGIERSFRSEQGFMKALQEMAHLADGAKWLMGHNIIEHDLVYLKKHAPHLSWNSLPVIDTLRLSPLAFPQNPYHRLIKNHKIISSEINSPLSDCQACWTLFQDQCTAFGKMKLERPGEFSVFETLFGPLPHHEIASGNIVIARTVEPQSPKRLVYSIREMLKDKDQHDSNDHLKVCRTRFLGLKKNDINNHTIYPALAYALSWLSVSGGNSVLAPWVRQQFPDTARLISELRDRDCGDERCSYCQNTLNPDNQLKRYFKLPAFRNVKGFEGGQRAVVESGMKGLHTLAVLPTGGGKSLCYQLPALNRYFRNGGLTVVVSPLQSLMKDQLDGLVRKGVTCAATLNGMIEVVERAEILDKIALGDIGILFIAPEQFRNESFISAIRNRQINGWVFDEAHCLSKWGHDFRPDYLYAVKFIARHSRQSGQTAPVSCFTATAKPDVLADITRQFRDQAGIEFRQFIGDIERDNLSYEVQSVPDNEKNQRIDELLHRELDHQDGGAVVFVGKRTSAETYAEYLKKKGWACEHFHAGLEHNEKSDIQDRFIKGDLRIIVATNAFGMGVDKPDVRLVVHAEITGSLENYLQEAGRAGRDQSDAKCILLYDGNDVDTQFGISKMSQIELRDLKSVWKKVGYLNEAANGKNGCGKIVATGGEILRDTDKYMSFDSDDRQADTKVKTALAWLERAGMLQRTENQTRIFPARSGRLDLQQALNLIEAGNFSHRIKDLYGRIVQIVFNAPDDRPLSTDDLIQATAFSFTELRGHLKKLEELGILTNDTLMTIILRTDNTKASEKQLSRLLTLEKMLWKILKDEIPNADQGEWQNLSLTSVCDKLRESGLETNPSDIKLMMQSLADDRSARKETRNGTFQLLDGGNNLLKIRFKDRSESWESVQETAELRRKTAACLLSFLIAKTHGVRQKDVTVETRMGELVEQLAEDVELSVQIPPKLREPLLRQALLFMHKQGVIKLNHGMTILRHAMTIIPDKNAIEARRQYLKEDFKPLEEFYGERRFQVHVMQEYALRALERLSDGLDLMSDYFRLEERIFKRKWFKGRQEELKESASPQTLREITGTLNDMQKEVVVDQSGKNRLVLAGPGSGKTRIIVHRVAYLLRVMHIPASAIIVLTFNRFAAQEVKHRLYALVGSLAAAVTVMTYDGMAMRLLGVRFGSKDRPHDDGEGFVENQFREWCKQATALLSDGLDTDAENDEARDRIMAGFRYILVDEYQDITEEHYNLVSALAGRKKSSEEDKLTILAVGDDDQNIYAFNGTSNEYIHRFQTDYKVEAPDYLTFNYRSTQHIISAANCVISGMPDRLKVQHPITINPERKTQPDGGVWEGQDPERQGRVRIIALPFASDTSVRRNIQAQAVVAELDRLKQYGTIEWDDIAVLSHDNATLTPLQAWCRQRSVPYFYSREKGDRIKLRHTREFLRLVDAAKQLHGKLLSSKDFVKLIHEQAARSGSQWPDWFNTLAQDFISEHPEPSGNEVDADEAQHSAASLINWLYEYVGNDSETRSEGMFLGTAHSAKGLEFKHVFILDDSWQKTEDEDRRLFYVAMTRAIETLTIIQNTPGHAWVNHIPPDAERTTLTFAPIPALNTRYFVLSIYKDLDLDFIVRSTEEKEAMRRLRTAANLKRDDPLQIRHLSDGRCEFLSGDTPVARTSSKCPSIPGHAIAHVSAFTVRHRDDVKEPFTKTIPNKIGSKILEKWPLIVPMVVIPPGEDHSVERRNGHERKFAQ